MTSSKLKTEFYAEINAIRIKAYNIHNRVKIVTKKEIWENWIPSKNLNPFGTFTVK